MSDAKGNEIEIAISKAKKKPGFLGGAPDSKPDAEAEGDEGGSEDEATAYKAFKSATSDEEGMKALKTFIKLCNEDY